MGQFLEKSYNEDTVIHYNACKENFANPKVSIIVPVYNTEKYLFKCLISLIQQTLKEIEIIVVNDGSTDGSDFIISKFKDADARIKVITQSNQKQGAARNNGTQIASGEYVGFVDSDDWIDPDYFEKLYNAAKKYDSDIALATNVRIGHGKTKKRLDITISKFVTSLQEKFDICNLCKDACPTNKIYRLSMLKNNNITWPENIYCEDKLFSAKAVYYANGIVSVPDIYYYYFRRPDSTVNNKSSSKKTSDRELARKQVLEFLKEKDVKIRDMDFWAIKKDFKFLGIPIYRIKESLRSEKHLLFSIIPVFERSEDREHEI